MTLFLSAHVCLAAPATARGEKAVQVEQLLKYLAYTPDGTGDKVIYMICGGRCPRCASLYKAIHANSQFLEAFQVRWVLYPDVPVGYLFPLENKPGAGMKELYTDMDQLHPKPVENPDRLKILTKYNALLSAAAFKLFEGNISENMTPFIVFKTLDGFKYGTLEDFQGKLMEVFSHALPLAKGVNIYDSGIVKTMDEAEKLSGYTFSATSKDVPLRFFPDDAAPLIGVSIPKGHGGKALAKTTNGWVGVHLFTDPNEPLAYAKLQDGQLHRK